MMNTLSLYKKRIVLVGSKSYIGQETIIIYYYLYILSHEINFQCMITRKQTFSVTPSLDSLFLNHNILFIIIHNHCFSVYISLCICFSLDIYNVTLFHQLYHILTIQMHPIQCLIRSQINHFLYSMMIQ